MRRPLIGVRRSRLKGAKLGCGNSSSINCLYEFPNRMFGARGAVVLVCGWPVPPIRKTAQSEYSEVTHAAPLYFAKRNGCSSASNCSHS